MFCPKCATQNVDGASFCRSCGANVSLVPQALSGQLPQAQPDDIGRGLLRYKKAWTKGTQSRQAVKNVFMGVAFLLVALRSGVFAYRNWMVVLDADTRILNDGDGRSAIHAY